MTTLNKYQKLVTDQRTGLARVENGSVGIVHSCHPNISTTGSVSGMIKQGLWDKNDVLITVGNFIYNCSWSVVTDELDQLAADNCECPVCRDKK